MSEEKLGGGGKEKRGLKRERERQRVDLWARGAFEMCGEKNRGGVDFRCCFPEPKFPVTE